MTLPTPSVAAPSPIYFLGSEVKCRGLPPLVKWSSCCYSLIEALFHHNGGGADQARYAFSLFIAWLGFREVCSFIERKLRPSMGLKEWAGWEMPKAITKVL
ncbi:hypothetical protein AVEN_260464-1 [Araneus ventricosus]|uniref:Uncharacterized protein n=1 Tax=Araneus ventricosus TaxID=182803 RepID=A0A4Y2LA48_ARAVE|nr:hypothetical protein AVEN_260464-1 [Araneus ventricosus]